MLCFGSTRNGQLGLGGIEDEVIRVPIENKYFERRKVKQIAAGYEHTLFLFEDGTLYSCGNNDYEQLGHDGTIRTRPEFIAALETQLITYVAAGRYFSVALNSKGQLFCWGSISGQRDDDLFYEKPT
jgi:E3 ubiquitin-protein ligase HERC4